MPIISTPASVDGMVTDSSVTKSMIGLPAGRLGEEGDQRHHGDRHRARDDAHLARDRRGRHRPLGPDVVLDRHVVDDRQHRVHDVPGAAQHRQRAGRERRQDRHVLRIAPQDLLRQLQQHVEAARGLQRGRGRHHRDDGQHHVDRRLARRQLEREHQDDDADAAEQAERDTALARAVEQAGEDQYDLQEEFHERPLSKMPSFSGRGRATVLMARNFAPDTGYPTDQRKPRPLILLKIRRCGARRPGGRRRRAGVDARGMSGGERRFRKNAKARGMSPGPCVSETVVRIPPKRGWPRQVWRLAEHGRKATGETTSPSDG